MNYNRLLFTRSLKKCKIKMDEECPSKFEDFAFCFSFLKKFGPSLSISEVTLLSLEKFLSRETLNPDDPITSVHQQLVSMVSRRPITMDNWPYVLGRMAYSSQIINENDLEYEEYTVQERLALLKFLCESQFTRNQTFKHRISKIPDGDSFWREKPVGLDKKGLRYWVLQDSSFSIRVYSEFKYLEYPFDYPQWTLLCGSLDQLLQLINSLSESTSQSNNEEGATTCTPIENSSKSDIADKPTVKRTRGSVGNKKEVVLLQQKNTTDVKGCMMCGKDTLYSKMLLCDGCDKECHTFCQYPILWTIPDTEWFCPSCRQVKLVDGLSAIHLDLTQSKLKYEQSIEDKRRKIKRLARGGVLVENIIQEQEMYDADEDEAPRRSGRSRKRIDYAELNELNIKMLQREYQYPVIGSGGTTTRGRSNATTNTTASVVRHSRNTRRNKGYVIETPGSSDLDKDVSPVNKEIELDNDDEVEESTCRRVQEFNSDKTHHDTKTHTSSSSLICSVPLDYMKSQHVQSLNSPVCMAATESPLLSFNHHPVDLSLSNNCSAAISTNTNVLSTDTSICSVSTPSLQPLTSTVNHCVSESIDTVTKLLDSDNIITNTAKHVTMTEAMECSSYTNSHISNLKQQHPCHDQKEPSIIDNNNTDIDLPLDGFSEENI